MLRRLADFTKRRERRRAVKDYLKEAFLFRWNLLFFLGGTAAAALTPLAGVLLPLVAAGEQELPRRPRVHSALSRGDRREGPRTAHRPPPRTRPRHLRRCRWSRCWRATSRGAHRFEGPARAVPRDARHRRRRPRRGRRSGEQRRRDPHAGPRSAALAVSPPAAVEDRARSLSADDERAGSTTCSPVCEEPCGIEGSREPGAQARRRRPHRQLAAGQHRDGRAAARQLRAREEERRVRLDRARSHRGKIQALAEMAVNRQDPDFLSSQVDSAAESMRQTEKAVSELQHLTGLADELEEPPAILEADLREVLRHDASIRPTRRPRHRRGSSPFPKSCPTLDSRRGPRSWRSCTSPGRPRRSCSTATPTI